MKLTFLWDEEKTRKLFKTHLILFTIGGVVATIYSLILPSDIPFKPLVITIPTLFTLSCFIYLMLLPRPKPAVRFLIFTLEAQLAAAIFMALTGGFLGIVQFAPYMFLIFAVFELGADATAILGIFSILTFIGVFIWSYFIHPQPNVLQNFLYYVGSYMLIAIIEHNLGREISLQFEARKKLEQIDDLKNQFITLTSHYLRTPLTVFKNFVSVVEQNPNLNQDQTLLKDVEVNIHNLESLVEKLLTISSIEKGQTKVITIPSDLNTTVSSIISDYQLLARNQGISLNYQPATQGLPKIPFDPIKLKQALSSLIDNAIKYNKTGGTVTVSLFLQKGWAVVRIADTGPGISKDKLQNIFSPFNRGGLEQAINFDKPGLGLSLYLAKLIVESHGGKLVAQSTEGQGSVFSIYLRLKM